VTGEVSVLLRPGAVFIEGVNSAHSLMAASKGVYGEAAGEWTPADALGYSKMLALTGIFYQRAAGARRAGGAPSDGGAPSAGGAMNAGGAQSAGGAAP
jgi:argininosuccinate synthase